MDRRRFLENSAKMAAGAALFLELANHLYPGSVFPVDPLEKARSWLEENGWRIEKALDREMYVAMKRWEHLGIAYEGRFSFTPSVNGRLQTPTQTLHQVKYQALKKEAEMERVRAYRDRVGPGNGGIIIAPDGRVLDVTVFEVRRYRSLTPEQRAAYFNGSWS